MGTNYYMFIKNKKVARDNFAEVDEYGNVVDVECVSADIIDPSFQEKLGDEGMLVINR